MKPKGLPHTCHESWLFVWEKPHSLVVCSSSYNCIIPSRRELCTKKRLGCWVLCRSHIGIRKRDSKGASIAWSACGNHGSQTGWWVGNQRNHTDRISPSNSGCDASGLGLLEICQDLCRWVQGPQHSLCKSGWVIAAELLSRDFSISGSELIELFCSWIVETAAAFLYFFLFKKLRAANA